MGRKNSSGLSFRKHLLINHKIIQFIIERSITMREYLTPDFDVTVYEIEDVITLSINENDSNGEGWWG